MLKVIFRLSRKRVQNRDRDRDENEVVASRVAQLAGTVAAWHAQPWTFSNKSDTAVTLISAKRML